MIPLRLKQLEIKKVLLKSTQQRQIEMRNLLLIRDQNELKERVHLDPLSFRPERDSGKLFPADVCVRQVQHVVKRLVDELQVH